jgi:hypothetical protein
MDFGLGKLDASETPLASKTYLLMAVGSFDHWRTPFGYHFANSIWIVESSAASSDYWHGDHGPDR